MFVHFKEGAVRASHVSAVSVTPRGHVKLHLGADNSLLLSPTQFDPVSLCAEVVQMIEDALVKETRDFATAQGKATIDAMLPPTKPVGGDANA